MNVSKRKIKVPGANPSGEALPAVSAVASGNKHIIQKASEVVTATEETPVVDLDAELAGMTAVAPLRLEGWGLSSEMPPDSLAVWGARAIFGRRGEVELVHDRTSMESRYPAQAQALADWIDNYGLPALKSRLREEGVGQMDGTAIEISSQFYRIKATPRSSGGHLYIGAAMTGDAAPSPGAIWTSERGLPKVGERVNVLMNGLGAGSVVGYFAEGDYQFLRVHLNKLGAGFDGPEKLLRYGKDVLIMGREWEPETVALERQARVAEVPAVCEKALPKRITPKTKINGTTLDEFRAGLPEHQRAAGYELMGRWFDVVKGAWLGQQQPMGALDVNQVVRWAKSLDLARPRGEENLSLLCRVNEADIAAHYDAIDLDRPLLFGTLKSKDRESVTFLLDGAHRIRKAFLEQRPLSFILLDESKTKLIEAR